MNITNIIKQVVNRGVAKLNRFQLEIIQPPRLSRNDKFIEYDVNNFTNELNFQCESASLPGDNIETNEDIFITPTRKTFGETKVTIRVGSDMKEKKFFDAWCDNIINEETHIIEYLDNIKTDINVYKMNDDLSEKIYGIQYIDAFPKSVSEISFSHGSSEYMTIDVNFVYRKFKRIKL